MPATRHASKTRLQPPIALDPARLRAPGVALIDFAEFGAPLWFADPTTQRVAWRAEEIAPLFLWAEACAHAGQWVVGKVDYDAAGAFGLPTVESRRAAPLAWFAAYSQPPRAAHFPPATPLDPAPCAVADISPQRYAADIAAILAWIDAGDCYQINHTIAARVDNAPDLAHLFLTRQALHRLPFAAWLATPYERIASFSPELFLRRAGDAVTTAPIKGTRPRHVDVARDAALCAELRASPKEQAEHVMIVDMARNDLGRVCVTGSIHAPRLMAPRSYATVHHLETAVRGSVRSGMGLVDLFAALFPAASITGAPKQRAMEIIRHREQRARGVYTGAIGVIQPGGDCVFNVAIRTVQQIGDDPPMVGLGGGIVADSNADAEWREIETKGAFLANDPVGGTDEPFGLIETMRVKADGAIPWLEDHLARLESSARALGIPCDGESARSKLEQAARETSDPCVLRLLLTQAGEMRLTTRDLPSPPTEPLRLMVCPYRVDGDDPLLRHKSTRRALFNQALVDARAAGFDDALICNHAGYATETAIRAIAVKLDGHWWVPPLSDGLLDSLWRRQAIDRLNARTRSITCDELRCAQTIQVGNALQQSQSAILNESCSK
ncbi:bifunctional anthranilate synthase component I family protein/class IV aminotransferase [Magnetofaba australis]|uniref:Putative para-aminobenzoate synthase component I n=1 Tax=Magnetofaba australis IT-1 TaxID=1434232 RepID=A0A1Y2K599_9PROT|nr:bifunctional anthranilate synthase component I family protein/class IV aminotransferase [Magnetofaba australis]OSM02294.1 putative para-aminobenzoate synthase component I [Magnetofaba australis IT-1]